MKKDHSIPKELRIWNITFHLVLKNFGVWHTGTDYDSQALTRSTSEKIYQFLDPGNQQKSCPHVIEPAVGINRLALMVVCDKAITKKGSVFGYSCSNSSTTYRHLHPLVQTVNRTGKPE